MSTDIPSKFKYIVSKNLEYKLMRSGPPRCYTFKLKSLCLDGMVKRLSIGERDHSKPNVTVLLVGETGTGKTTVVNALFNYIVGVEWTDSVWFQIVEEGMDPESVSKTSGVTVYEIFGFEGIKAPFSLTIIDSPGYGETNDKGAAESCQEKIIAEQLHCLFSEKGMREIHAVCLVMNANENRLSDRLKYIFDAVGSLFGKDLENNIVVILTHSLGLPANNALQALKDGNVKCAQDDSNKPVHFLFNNCNNYAITDSTKCPLELAWKSTMQQMDEFINHLQNAAPEQLKKTTMVLAQRVKLADCIGNIQKNDISLQSKHTAFQQTQEALKQNKEEMLCNQEYTTEVDEPFKEKVPNDGWWDNKALCCTVCEETCHYPGCIVARNAWWCTFIQGNHCTVCTGRCHHTKHVKEKWRFENKTRKVKKTLEDVKQKYEKKKEEVGEKERSLSHLRVEIKDLKEKEASLVEEAYQSIIKLEEIALNTNSMYIHNYLDTLINKMKDQQLKVEELKKIKIRGEEEQNDGRRYLEKRL